MEVEKWKTIEWNPNYQVSNLGRVKSIERKVKHRNSYITLREKILKPFKNKDGYLRVNLLEDGKIRHFSIHRLVASAFVQNESLFNTEINHLDENKENNCASNLEWSDRKHNCNYGSRNERLAKAFSIPVKCLETGYIYPSTMYIERELGFNHSNIVYCCNGKRKSAYKLHWKYVE